MFVIDRFSRKEIMELTGATSNQLQSLERAGLVIPERIWNEKKKPEVYYTWEQLLDIKAIRDLRENTSLQMIRRVLEYFDKCNIDGSLRDKRIVVAGNEVFWIKEDWSDLGCQISALKVGDKRGKGIGQYTLLVLPAFQEVVDDIWDAAENSTVIDIGEFRNKAKAEHSRNAKAA